LDDTGGTDRGAVHIIYLNPLGLIDQAYVAVTTTQKYGWSTTSANYDQHSIQIFKLEDPTGAACEWCGFTLKDKDSYQDSGFTTIYGQYDLESYVVGGIPYALSAAYSSSEINAIDLSNPLSTSISDTYSLRSYDVEIYTQGGTQYALVPTYNNLGTTSILNISDPTNITRTGYISTQTDSDMSTYNYGAETFDHDGRRLGVLTSFGSDQVVLMDINDSTNPQILDKIQYGLYYTTINNPREAFAFESGGNDYVMVFNTSTKIEVLEISDASDQIHINVGRQNFRTETLDLTDSVSYNIWNVQTVLSESLELRDQILAAREIFLNESLNMTTSFSRIADYRREFDEKLFLTGKPSSPLALDIIENGIGGFSGLNFITDIDVFTIGSATYAIVAARSSNAVTIINISDPENLVYVSSISESINSSLELAGAESVEVFTIGASTYAIVGSITDDGIQILDISDPTSIVAKDKKTDGDTGFTKIQDPYNVKAFEINGNPYAAVASYSENYITIVDLSDVDAITSTSGIVDYSYISESNFNYEFEGPNGMDAQEINGQTYLLVAGYLDDGITLFKISSAGIISLVKERGDYGEDTVLDGPRYTSFFFIYPDYYAITTAGDEQGIQINKVTNTSNQYRLDLNGNAVHGDSGFSKLQAPYQVDVFVGNEASVHKNRYAVSADYTGQGIQITDVTNPSTPTGVGSMSYNTNSFGVSSPYAVKTFEMNGYTYGLVGG
ncbi:MAG: hypothetical protein VW683_16670, partial [Betaproteobacteria bacterium]